MFELQKVFVKEERTFGNHVQKLGIFNFHLIILNFEYVGANVTIDDIFQFGQD